MTALRFTLAELERAHETWGANCGPAATLDEVRSHMPGVRCVVLGAEAEAGGEVHRIRWYRRGRRRR